MVSSDKDRGKSRRLGTEDRGWLSTGQVLDGWAIERSDNAVCCLHRARGDVERGFLGLFSKPRFMVSPGLASKPIASVLWFGFKTSSFHVSSNLVSHNSRIKFWKERFKFFTSSVCLPD
jgi:hypothetical protein